MSESPQHQELTIQFAILQRMISELPDDIARPLLDQLNAVIQSITARDRAISKLIIPELEDIRLSIKAMEFDLEATKSEKQILTDKLRDAGLE